jgi:2-oxoisovalerate ferredoxin oxidoreductase beta subunit
VKKDVATEPWYKPNAPSFDPALMSKLVGGTTEHPARFCAGFPNHVAPREVSLKFAGAGGDGAQTAAMLVARAGTNEGFDATRTSPATGRSRAAARRTRTCTWPPRRS